MFKVYWEKTSVTYQLPEGTIEKMVGLAYPDTKLISHALIAGGCAKCLIPENYYLRNIHHNFLGSNSSHKITK
jgi:hypothetical protein